MLNSETRLISTYETQKIIARLSSAKLIALTPEDIELPALTVTKSTMKYKANSFVVNQEGSALTNMVIPNNLLTAIEPMELQNLLFRLSKTIEHLNQEIQHKKRTFNQSEQRYQMLVEEIAQPICRLLPNGTVIFVNHAYCQQFQQERSQIIGQNFFNSIPPEAQQATREHFASLDRENPVKSRSQLLNLPTGEQRLLEWTDRAIFDEEGNKIEIQSVGREISSELPEKHCCSLEIALQESQQALEATFEQINLGMAHIAVDGRLLRVNQNFCKILGYTPRELENANLAKITHPDDLKMDKLYLEQLLSNQRENLRLSRRYLRKNRSLVWVNFHLSLARQKSGKPVYFVVTIEDISDRQRTEEKLRHQAAQERLLSKITRQISSSLNFDEIINTAVAEVRQFLQADRIIIFRFAADGSGMVTHESVTSETMKIQNSCIVDPCFQKNYLRQYQEGRVKAVNDIYNAGLSRCYIEMLEKFQVKAHIVVPILQQEELWGLLIVHQCSEPRKWQPREVMLLLEISAQMGIASQQAELYQRLAAANRELRRIAHSDGLTGLANRRCFDSYLELEWRRSHRQRASLSIILCDIDYFKLYNDTYGHQAGDDCLQKVASAIADTVKRPADLVARYGGEEFVIILPNTTVEGALKVAKNIHDAVKSLAIPHLKSEVSEFVTLSLGVAATIPKLALSPDTLVAAADDALYQAKSAGRSRAVANFHPL
ncbi:MAG: diguanylate cyclase [Kamptonema sp. SIO1D9]|nr:diguanylate cyclase [Kamptonema sp. SIO1D9]